MSDNRTTIIRGPLLNPRSNGAVDFFHDGALAADDDGRINFVGDWAALGAQKPSAAVRLCDGLILPPLLDAHIHIPQWPIRGRFMEGVDAHAEGGRLIAGLNRNVFPAEARCQDESVAERTIRDFLADTLAHGVVGGAAYMTVHASATRLALEILPDTWSVGLVLMNQNCPPDLRTDEAALERNVAELARRFARRLIVTDRFAPVVDSSLRRRGVALAERFGLRMQTHLNEQISEKALVERALYPNAASYTDVYKTDGLLGREPILAHCVRMSAAEFAEVAAAPGAIIAHCPTSNALLGSGIMPLDAVFTAGVPYAICTDVGASPTTSLLAEAAQFLKVHAGRSDRATPAEAIFRITQAPAVALGLAERLGEFAVGKPLSFIEVECDKNRSHSECNQMIRESILELPNDIADLRLALGLLDVSRLDSGPELDRLTKSIDETVRALDGKVRRVTMSARVVFERMV